MTHSRRPAPRNLRVASVLQASLAEWLLHEGAAPWNERLTITRVEVSPDLGVVRAWVLDRLDDSAEDRKQALSWLQAQAGELRGRLTRDHRLRRAPRLDFRYDEPYAGAAALGEVFHQLREEDAGASAVDDGGDAAGNETDET